MSAHWTDKFSFVTGSLRTVDLAYLVLVDDSMAESNEDHSFVSVWHAGEWYSDDLPEPEWSIVSSTVIKEPIEQALFLGLWGEIRCVGSGDAHDEVILLGEQNSPVNRGPMTALATIDGKAYAVGMNRQVYLREGVNSWRSIDQGVFNPDAETAIYGFETICGYSNSEIYVAGRRGEIWEYDGTDWSIKGSPTNLILTDSYCAEDGNVYICGRLGTIVVGRHDNWQLVEQDLTEEDFWSIVEFQNSIYVSTMNYIYKMVNHSLQRVEFLIDQPASCHRLSVVDGMLWSIGAKDIMAYDGVNWNRIE